MVPMERLAVSTPQNLEREEAGTKLAAMTCSDGIAAASPRPIKARAARSGVRPMSAAAGVAAWAMLHSTSPAPSTTLGEEAEEASPAGPRPRKYPNEKAEAMRPRVESV
eukprot:scaffold30032_cov138-Isochrysis_galbana.AAC.11